jgi:hypothetical protein
MPATIKDPKALDEIVDALKGKVLGGLKQINDDRSDLHPIAIRQPIEFASPRMQVFCLLVHGGGSRIPFSLRASADDYFFLVAAAVWVV